MKNRTSVCIIDCEKEEAFRAFILPRPINMPGPPNSQPPRLVGLTGENLIIIEPLAGGGKCNLACWRITGLENGLLEAKQEI